MTIAANWSSPGCLSGLSSQSFYFVLVKLLLPNVLIQLGFDEMDEVSGSGWAELLEDGTLEIEFAYHLGDQAVLKAERVTSSTAC